ncbi:putative ABC transporter ATP-binding protein [uncultured archaeon]|nr:putative ABC transporter ATP-binding protein [uncultured archaeon]
MIETRELTKTYMMGKVTVKALDAINISIEQGEFMAVMGSSGSGKTTFLNMIGMLDTPSSGQILFDGVDATKLSEGAKVAFRLNRLGYIFQFFSLFDQLSAIENVTFPMMLAGNQSEPSKKAKELLEVVGLGHRFHHKPSELSGGQQQRVAIARALANNPKILLADEPTGNLDRKSSNEIVELFKQLNKEHGLTIVLVTHDQEVGGKADRIIKFRDGKIEKP